MDEASPQRITIEAFHRLTGAALPLTTMFGMRLERLEPGLVTARMPFRPELVRPGGTVAGPVLMALADYAMYAVVLSLEPWAEQAVTSNLNINFLRRPPPADVLAEGRIIRLGRRLAVCEVLLRSDGQDDPVAHVTGTYAMPARE